MNYTWLFAMLACVLIGFILGAVLGFSVAKDMEDDGNVTIEHIKVPEQASADVWREDLDDPEG